MARYLSDVRIRPAFHDQKQGGVRSVDSRQIPERTARQNRIHDEKLAPGNLGLHSAEFQTQGSLHFQDQKERRQGGTAVPRTGIAVRGYDAGSRGEIQNRAGHFRRGRRNSRKDDRSTAYRRHMVKIGRRQNGSLQTRGGYKTDAAYAAGDDDGRHSDVQTFPRIRNKAGHGYRPQPRRIRSGHCRGHIHV